MDSQNFDQALNLDTATNDISLSQSTSSFLSTYEPETDPEPRYYHPRVLLDMNWNDGDDDIFILNMFKKVFACQNESDSKCVDQPASTLTDESKTSHPPWTKESRFFATSSSNMVTQYVSVPTSKHVAQILGKKGSKIRALRETTSTYIRSPLPREESVFIVKGKNEDVLEAVKAIKSASDFFTYLEQEKEMCRNTAITSCEGHVITVKLSIPERFVGLVVGVKGGTIKEIEKQTKAYIQSPTKHSDPVFTIIGSTENCEKAMNLISRYLALRGVGPGIIEDSDNFSASGCDYFFTWLHVAQATNN